MHMGAGALKEQSAQKPALIQTTLAGLIPGAGGGT